MTEVKPQSAFIASAADNNVNKSAKKRLAGLLPRLPKFVAGASAMVLAAALATGDTSALEDEFSNFCNSNLSGHSQDLCQHVIALKNLDFMDKLAIVAFAEQHQNNPAALDIIKNIAQTSDKLGMDIDTALSIATLEGAFKTSNPAFAWQGDNINFTMQALTTRYQNYTRKYEDNAYKQAVELYADATDEYDAPLAGLSEGEINGVVARIYADSKHDMVAELYLSRLLSPDVAGKLTQMYHDGEASLSIIGLTAKQYDRAPDIAKSLFGKGEAKPFAQIYADLYNFVAGHAQTQEQKRRALGAENAGNLDAVVQRQISAIHFTPPSADPIGEIRQKLESSVADFAGVSRVAQSVTNTDQWVTTTYHGGITNSDFKRPHTILSGMLDDKKADEFLAHLEAGLKAAGPDAYYYAVFSGPGGSIPAVRRINERMNELLKTYPKMRAVAVSANSALFYATAAFKGTRFALTGSQNTAHAPRIQFEDGNICFKETCAKQSHRDLLEADLDMFANDVAITSCVLQPEVAKLLFKREDLTLSAADMHRMDLVDYVIDISNGWPKVISEKSGCEPLGINELMHLATGFKPQADGPDVYQAPFPVPVPRPAERPKRVFN